MIFRTFLIGCKTLSVEMLHALVENSEFEVVGVLTKDHWDDMKVWRDMGEESLEMVAWRYGIKIYKNEDINSMEEELTDLNLDYIFSASWPKLLNKRILELPRIGCFNVHVAMLPKNRGCLPIHWAIINGDDIGVTIHKMATGPDNGHIVAQEKAIIDNTYNAKVAWKSSMILAAHLFRRVLPSFADLTFEVVPQDESEATHHSDGIPYRGQINPYWDDDKKERFVRAMDFPPFKNTRLNVPPIMKGFDKPSVRIAIGFDCDAPRGSFIASAEGIRLAEDVRDVLIKMRINLNLLGIARTNFVTGGFLKAMKHSFNNTLSQMKHLLCGKLIEIADHTYYHSAIKKIPTRPDRPPINSLHVMKEWETNTKLFKEMLGLDIPKRGFRTPYGYYQGLQGKPRLLDRLSRDGILYVSGDLRDEFHNVYGKLIYDSGVPRQPYRYENGILEIPSHGWQDTAFRGGKTPVVNIPKPPYNLHDILVYYEELIKEAYEIAKKHKRDYFLALTLHPHALMKYDPTLRCFEIMKKELDKIGGSFCRHIDIFEHYGGF